MAKHSNRRGYRVVRVMPRRWERTLEKLPPPLSPKAKQRLHWVDFSRKHGVVVAAEAAGVSTRTIKRWRATVIKKGVAGLEPKSRAPTRRRGPTWTPAQLETVRTLRCAAAGRGKGKVVLQHLLAADGIVLSVSMVGRMLRYLRQRRAIVEPHRTVKRQVRNPRPHAIRRPRGTPAPSYPGDLIQIDTVHLRPMPGVELRQFSAIDVVTRLAVTDVRTSASGRTARDHLHLLLDSLPYPVRAIQVDGGSEFMAEFEAACQAMGIVLYELPPRSPRLNGCVERFNRTTREEFWAWYGGMFDLPTARTALQRWTSRSNALRPHASLRLQTPLDVYQSLQGT